jgi:hypothetical protein
VRARSRPGRSRITTLALLVVVLGVISGFVMASGGIARAMNRLATITGQPVAVPDNVTLSQGVRGQPIAVLDNDRDPNGDRLEIVSASAETGTLTHDGTRLRYDPLPTFTGVDRGTYTIRDPTGGMATTSVTITVVANAPPIPVHDAVALASGVGRIDVLANDTDPDGNEVALVAVAAGRGGTAVIEEGMIAYTANPGFSGIDRIVYTVADAVGLRAEAYVDVSVPSATCSGAVDDRLDEDGDRYDNTDESANGTNPCDAASTPVDSDGDGASDRADAFYLDPADGRLTQVPVMLSFEGPSPGTVLDTGFTGVMRNGSVPGDLLDAAGIELSDGALHIGSHERGDAFRSENAQRNALQLGIRVPTTPFTIHGQLHAPFATSGFESAGIYVGSGDQDNYLKLAVSAAGGEGGIKVTYEDAGEGRGAALRRDGSIIEDAVTVDLYIRVDPATGISQSSYSVDGGPRLGLGASAQLPIPDGWSEVAPTLAVGVIVTPALGNPPYVGTWELFEVTFDTP